MDKTERITDARLAKILASPYQEGAYAELAIMLKAEREYARGLEDQITNIPTLCRKYEGELKMLRITVNELQLHIDLEIERAEKAEAALARVAELPEQWRERGRKNNAMIHYNYANELEAALQEEQK